MTNLLVLSRDDVQSLLSMEDARDATERVFAASAHGRADNVGVLQLDATAFDGSWSVKPGYLPDQGLVGVKIVSGYYGNVHQNLPTILGAILLCDARSGIPLAVLDGMHITAVRTGAAGGVAAKHLARRESRTVGVVGAGTQGRMQVLALKGLFSIDEVRVFDVDAGRLAAYVTEMSTELGMRVTAVRSPEVAVRGSDIVITVTPSREPYLRDAWIQDGSHVNAIGADALGKRELDPATYRRAKLVTDDRKVAILKGLFAPTDIYAELGEVINGTKKGRESANELTLFDSTGVGIQDVAVAGLVYERAKRLGLGQSVKFL